MIINMEIKKRGRPKKNIPKPIIENTNIEDEIILHLPISIKDINSKQKPKNDPIKSNPLQKFQLVVPDIKTKNGKSIVNNPTRIVCWWCTYEFDSDPIFLPESYIDDKFYVLGCFCSFNCALSYNLNLNDYKIWERISLLNKMYYMTFGKYDIIKPAPSREILEKFGGSISIEEFRKSLLKEYRLVFPPMIPIIPFIEERRYYIKR